MAEEILKTSISLEKSLLELGREQARREMRSFSSHAAKLLQADLVRAGWLTIDGKVTEAGRAALSSETVEVPA